MEIYQNTKFIPNRFLSASEKEFFGPMEAHGHDFFELEYILDGEGGYTVDGVRYEAASDTLFFMTPAAIHEIAPCRLHLINLMFCGVLYEELAGSVLLHTPCLRLTREEAAFVRPLLFEAVAIQERDTAYALLLLRCVLHKLCARQTAAETGERSYAERAVLYILENFRARITLSDVAAHLGLSYSYLSDLFARETGKGFQSYLDGVRFSHAKNLLLFTDLTVFDVCERAGFGDYANFARRFRAHFACTPREMRRSRGM